jgi:hypothetical protein
MDQQHGQCMTQALCLHQAVNIYRSRHVTHANNRVHDVYILAQKISTESLPIARRDVNSTKVNRSPISHAIQDSKIFLVHLILFERLRLPTDGHRCCWPCLRNPSRNLRMSTTLQFAVKKISSPPLSLPFRPSLSRKKNPASSSPDVSTAAARAHLGGGRPSARQLPPSSSAPPPRAARAGRHRGCAGVVAAGRPRPQAPASPQRRARALPVAAGAGAP